MKTAKKAYYKGGITTSYVLIIPIFMFFFMMAYKPFDILETYQMPINRYAFIMAILLSIEIVINLFSRMAMLLTRERLQLELPGYLFWEFWEIAVFCMFAALFIWLYTGHKTPYFSVLPVVMLYSYGVLAIPYTIITMLCEINTQNTIIAESQALIEKFRSGQIGAENSPVHLLDDKGNLKLLVTADSILYIEGADNYVNICYLQSGKMIQYSLRNTMKGITDICMQNNLVRCHRSYFINLRKVKIIKKEKDGLIAELEHPGTPNIPISKTFATEVIDLFSAINTH